MSNRPNVKTLLWCCVVSEERGSGAVRNEFILVTNVICFVLFITFLNGIIYGVLLFDAVILYITTTASWGIPRQINHP